MREGPLPPLDLAPCGGVLKQLGLDIAGDDWTSTPILYRDAQAATTIRARIRATCRACWPRCRPSSTAWSDRSRPAAADRPPDRWGSVRGPGTTARSRRTTASFDAGASQTSAMSEGADRLPADPAPITSLSSCRTTSSTGQWRSSQLRRTGAAAVGANIAVTGWRQVLAAPGPRTVTARTRSGQVLLPALRAELPARSARSNEGVETPPPVSPTRRANWSKAMKGVAKSSPTRATNLKLKDTTASAPRPRAKASSAGCWPVVILF